MKSSTNDSKKKNKHNKMSTLKEAKEIDDEEEDAGITIKVNILGGKIFWREFFGGKIFFLARIFLAAISEIRKKILKK